jgi:hypothetical protein
MATTDKTYIYVKIEGSMSMLLESMYDDEWREYGADSSHTYSTLMVIEVSF